MLDDMNHWIEFLLSISAEKVQPFTWFLRKYVRFAAVISLLLFTTNPSSGQENGSETNLTPHFIIRCHHFVGLYHTTNGAITADGREVIVVERGKGLALYRVSDQSKTQISDAPEIFSAWTDSQTGGVFVLSKKGSLKANPRDAVMHYFLNIDALKKWAPNWKRSGTDLEQCGIQWLPRENLFAFYKYDRMETHSTNVTLIDLAGNDVGAFRVSGNAIGMDTGDEGMEIYFAIESLNQPTIRVKKGRVNKQRDKVISQIDLYLIDRNSIARSPGIHDVFYHHMGFRNTSRLLRLRGGLPGDMRKYVTQLLSKPDFWHYRDVPSFQPNLYLRTGMTGVDANLNMVGAAESDSEFEIYRGVSASDQFRFPPPSLANHRGETVSLPDVNGQILDAIPVDGGWVVTTFEDVVVEKSGEIFADMRVWTSN